MGNAIDVIIFRAREIWGMNNFITKFVFILLNIE